MLWKNYKKNPPTIEGLYVAAVFDKDGNMVEYSTNYCCLGSRGHLIPNSANGGYLDNTPTHYMPYKEYRKLLESAPREDEEGNIEW